MATQSDTLYGYRSDQQDGREFVAPAQQQYPDAFSQPTHNYEYSEPVDHTAEALRVAQGLAAQSADVFRVPQQETPQEVQPAQPSAPESTYDNETAITEIFNAGGAVVRTRQRALEDLQQAA